MSDVKRVTNDLGAEIWSPHSSGQSLTDCIDSQMEEAGANEPFALPLGKRGGNPSSIAETKLDVKRCE